METYKIKQYQSIQDVNWDNVDKANIDHYDWTDDIKFTAYAQMVFVKNYGFVVKETSFEKEPWAEYKNDGDPVCLDSTLEAFLKFNDEGYVNLEANSIGARHQGFGIERNNRLSLTKEKKDFKVETHVEKDYWYILIYIPLNTLKNIYQKLDVDKVKEGFIFEGNFYKTGTRPISKLVHYGMWNKINSLNADFHRPEQFGKLIID